MNPVFESIFEESVYHFDLETYHKLSYARANISVYWIIDLVKQQVEVYDNLQGIEYLDKKYFLKRRESPFLL